MAAAARSVRAVARGVGVSAGVGVGRAHVGLESAADALNSGDPVVLLAEWTTPADEAIMRHCAAVVTSKGGRTSHAAVVCREWGIPCVAAVKPLVMSPDGTKARLGEHEIGDGEWLKVDGDAGTVLPVDAPDGMTAIPAAAATDVRDAVPRMPIPVRLLANADSAAVAARAVESGAAGVGLCRSEHFFGRADLDLLRTVLAGDDPAASSSWEDFERLHLERIRAICAVLGDRPLTVRLLDMAAHELGGGGPREINPMLGVRGARTGILKPEVYRHQLRGMILGAAGESNPQRVLRILVPLVADAAEVVAVRRLLEEALAELAASPLRPSAVSLPTVELGAMIETPRIALMAASLAHSVDFVSFGTNDLTQFTWGLSRDDANLAFEEAYRMAGLWPASPFEVLDQAGVGALIETAIAQLRATSPTVSIGACGEHCADPVSARWLVAAGVDTMSVAPHALASVRQALSETTGDPAAAGEEAP